jgi:hypothetical protein
MALHRFVAADLRQDFGEGGLFEWDGVEGIYGWDGGYCGSMRVAADPVSACSVARRCGGSLGEAWMDMRTGEAERARDQERVKARARQARVVVRYWTSIPAARDDAILTSSVSLFMISTKYI